MSKFLRRKVVDSNLLALEPPSAADDRDTNERTLFEASMDGGATGSASRFIIVHTPPCDESLSCHVRLSTTSMAKT